MLALVVVRLIVEKYSVSITPTKEVAGYLDGYKLRGF